MKKITLAGNILVDNVKTISAWPEKGMLVPITAFSRAVGGSVCNSGIDLKTLDPSIEVRALGKVGNDDAGDFAVENHAKVDVPTRVAEINNIAIAGMIFLSVFFIVFFSFLKIFLFFCFFGLAPVFTLLFGILRGYIH